MKTKYFSWLVLLLLLLALNGYTQKASMAFTVRMENPEWHFFQVALTCKGVKKEFVDFKLPVWTPGYYQRLDFAKNLYRLNVTDDAGNELKWEKTNENTWRVFSNNSNSIHLKYEIKTSRSFVAEAWLDETRAYILPAAVFLHIDKMINNPVQVTVVPDGKWNRVGTGLDSVAGKKFTYTAPDFDILYDSPMLVGNLEELPPFKIRGITHRFIGFKLGDFDRQQFMLDLKKMVDAAVNIIGHIPYKTYTFIAIGPGQGGIEHLNNTTFSFNGSNFNNRNNYIRTMHFLAHEYFHHYNVKRIRPIELGPFDYDKGGRTKMLWLSEGISVYYEYLVVRRAGISTDEELLNALRGNMMAFENKPGRLYQTLEQASYETWSDGPFGRTGDEINKTISYYDKGPVVGWLLDLKIREVTENKKSLDDVMRYLYKEYYQKKKRGFSDEELRTAFENIAGSTLAAEFEYINNTKELDYPTYLSYAGLQADTTTKELPAPYVGFSVRERNDSVFITNVDYESPAWNAGIRRGQYVTDINGIKPSADFFTKTIAAAKTGDKLGVGFLENNNPKSVDLIFIRKKEKNFPINKVPAASDRQKQILEAWLKG